MGYGTTTPSCRNGRLEQRTIHASSWGDEQRIHGYLAFDTPGPGGGRRDGDEQVDWQDVFEQIRRAIVLACRRERLPGCSQKRLGDGRSGGYGFSTVSRDCTRVTVEADSRFKHRFSKVLPLAPFLVSSTPTPSHPFVVLAILTHIPVIAGSLVAPLVEESVRHVFSGAVGQEVMLAFLILALRPSRPDQMGGPSPLRLLSTAYEIGKSLGLERFARAACKRKTVLCEPWWADVLERILLVS